MSQSYTYENLRPTAPQLLYLLNNTTYRERIIQTARNTPLVDHLIGDYQFVQRQYQHFDSLMTATNLQLNRLAVDIAASGFMIPGQLTITLPPPGERHLPQMDWNILLDLPPRPLRTMSSSRAPDPPQPHHSRSTVSIQTDSISQNHLRVLSPDLSQTPPPHHDHPCPQNPSPETSDSESSSPQRSRILPSPQEPSLIEPLPHPLVSLTQYQQTTTQPIPGPPGIGQLQRTLGTPPPGLFIQSPLNSSPNPPAENNAEDATTKPESRTSSLPINLVSMTDFLDAIGAISAVTIHRTVQTTNARSATQSNLTISLNIAHDYDTVNEFLLQALPGVIHLLTALRMTMVIRPPSPTSLTSPTPTEEEETPPIYTVIRITDDREPFNMVTEDGEERRFVPVRYINGAVVFEAGTSNENRG
ncbi:hypothetical protein Moror_9394 [Moniliophthora roreri MCA 2997]|uniref:Uncharacterized protein n=1 Tax=Moniliophthora roreri (strain MCA 2997) TaxID=1381753 RepID=V2WWT4_MONRO|nr:hypothetical protein Moror_9394 [Moniliophthora roreri MCA 2997]